jgi:hypothetical protein
MHALVDNSSVHLKKYIRGISQGDHNEQQPSHISITIAQGVQYLQKSACGTLHGDGKGHTRFILLFALFSIPTCTASQGFLQAFR